MQLRPSRTLAAATNLPGAPASLVAVGLGLSLVHHLRLALHRSDRAIAGLSFAADGRLAVADPAGAWLNADLRHCAVPAAWLAVVTVRDRAGCSRAAVILPDAADPAGFRGLRVWLKWRLEAPADGTEGASSDASG